MIRYVLVFSIFVVILLFVLIKLESLPKKYRLFIVFFVLCVGFFGFTFEYFQSKRIASELELLSAFRQNKTLICNKRIVDQEHFVFHNGTSVFMGRAEFNDLRNLKIPLQECSIMEK